MRLVYDRRNEVACTTVERGLTGVDLPKKTLTGSKKLLYRASRSLQLGVHLDEVDQSSVPSVFYGEYG
jgi:hypothetical protein